MIKVKSHGNSFIVRNPANTAEETKMINVVFIEEGRPDFGSSISRSSAFLSSRAGTQVGLNYTRTHTQPISVEDIEKYPVGSVHEGHINRIMYSTPQIRTQETVVARMYDGKPTYFLTELGASPEPDVDKRMALDTLAHLNPLSILRAQVGSAVVTPVEPLEEPVEEPVAHADLAQA